MKTIVLLTIFLIVWVTIAVYLFTLDKKVRDLKKYLKFREKPE
ncbi:MAG: CcmD family protein [Calditrichia bacterium]